MKFRLNTKLFKLLVAVMGTLASINIAAAQSITTAPTTSTQTIGTTGYNGGKPVTGPGSGYGSQPIGQYWDEVYGDDDFQYTGKTRYYYIAAEEVVWNYAPDGTNLITGGLFEGQALNFVTNSNIRIGTEYIKCVYKEYTNDQFTQPKSRPAEDGYLGYLGPTIHAEVGDIIKVVFLNKCKFAASVHPHAVFYNKDSEGAPYNDGTSPQDKLDDAVPTNSKYTYTWRVPKRAGPGPMDGSSIMWMYHSHTDELVHLYAGLVGCMSITRKGMAKPDGTPKDVDREIFIMYSITNENLSPYLRESFIRASNPDPTAPFPGGGFAQSNNKNIINGFIYGNGPMITLKKGQRVRWYVMSMGTGGDAHTPQWHGNTCLVAGMRMDVLSLLAAEMATADMCPDNVGIWMFHCHVGDHLNNGMATRYEVKP